MNHRIELNANGLQLTSLPSKALPIDHIDSSILSDLLKKYFNLGSVMLWLDDRVLIGKWQDGDLQFYQESGFDFKYVQRLRVFNNNKEIHVWRSGEQWLGRIRIDEEGNETAVVIAHQLLFGTKGRRLDAQFIQLTEDRGTTLTLPLTNFHFEAHDNPQSRIFIKTHNYVRTNRVFQATYFDCRFVAFTDGSKEIL